MTDQIHAHGIYMYIPFSLFSSVLPVHEETSLSQELTRALQGISGT